MSDGSWNLDPPPGFQGLRNELPLTVYRRHLPHWRQPGATYFVTFRLADSLPQSKLRELDRLREDWIRRHGTDADRDDLDRDVVRRVERWLDQGMGECLLGRSVLAKEVAGRVLHWDEVKYEVGCFVVMPNHVHAVVRPFDVLSLEKCLQGWKKHSSIRINRRLGRSGTLWQEESFDRIVRDAEHLWRCIQYIGRNPGMASIPNGPYRPWIRPSWVELGWPFEGDARA